MKLLADRKIPFIDTLFPDFDVTTYSELTPALLTDISVLITRANTRCDAALLREHSVKVVASPSSGRDHFDEAWLAEQHIQAFNAPGCNAIAVAEYVMGIFALCHQLVPQAYRVGIIGVGHIGSRVAHYAEQLGFEVLLNDPPRAEREVGFNSTDLNELTSCDIITCHTPLTHGKYPTHHLLNHEFLMRLPPGTIIINTARGEIINTQAALQLMDRLSFVADVFEHEPKINADYASQCLLATPHIAGHSIEGKRCGVMMIQQQIYQHFNLTPPTPTQYPKSTCLVPTHQWETTVLNAYNPHHDKIRTVQEFQLQRNQYRQRHEHEFIFEDRSGS